MQGLKSRMVMAGAFGAAVMAVVVAGATMAQTAAKSQSSASLSSAAAQGAGTHPVSISYGPGGVTEVAAKSAVIAISNGGCEASAYFDDTLPKETLFVEVNGKQMEYSTGQSGALVAGALTFCKGRIEGQPVLKD